ncbi:macrofage activating glycoprotein [Moniliophthora roreri MCA 2997]|uniref:Macrofage activating glycoprotein n=1 Tax=Moniliophthora roreri (strain MCA 2997) TaxID=1381753 RepID=V2XTQ6_MONRO|nr:macrofage activating glycoprotein [Moniliophthora roreri MCA 2997]
MLSAKFASMLAAILVSVNLANAQTPNYLGQLVIRPRLDNSKCLTAMNDTDGAEVVIQTCTGADAQKWTFTDGTVKIFNDKCLDVTDGETEFGTKLQIWTCSDNHNPNQQFWYTGDLHLAWTNHERCMDLTNGSPEDGNRPQMWECIGWNSNQFWNVGYMANNLPEKSEQGQSGTNKCDKTTEGEQSQCQTVWINNADDFCLFAPPSLGTIGETERIEVAYCAKSGRGARTIPDGTLGGVHFVKTPDYVQVTGVGNFTKINVPGADDGGELDPHGADGNGNPIGGLVYGNSFGDALQYHEWTSFISDREFCFRACVGDNSATLCQHIYDVMGCQWNMPANYNADVFENCDGDSDLPMGIYGTSTWYQGTKPTPDAHPAASSSNCVPVASPTVTPVARKRESNGFEKLKRHSPLPAPKANA